MSLAMILIQQNDASHPKLGPTREIYKKIIGDKHADAMAKFGAALSQGIIDAGGRNVTISMQNKSKSGNMPAIVGMALFNQFWYWFPLAHCLSLAFTPTAIIGVNKDLQVRSLSFVFPFPPPPLALLVLLPTDPPPAVPIRLEQIPKFDFISSTKPSLFAYQPATKPPAEKKVEKVETAVLSTTAKASQRQREKEKAEKGEGEDEEETVVETEEAANSAAAAGGEDAEMKVDGEEKKDGEATEDESKKDGGASSSSTKKPRKAPEPSTTTLSNLSRVTPAQLAYISFPSSTSRFQPIRPVNSGTPLPAGSVPSAKSSSLGGVGAGGGILLVRDTKPEEEVELLEMEVLKAIDVSGAGAAAPAAEEAAAGGGEAGDGFETAPIAEVPPPFEYTEWD